MTETNTRISPPRPVCASCGTTAAFGWEFCRDCGSPLAAPLPPPSDDLGGAVIGLVPESSATFATSWVEENFRTGEPGALGDDRPTETRSDPVTVPVRDGETPTPVPARRFTARRALVVLGAILGAALMTSAIVTDLHIRTDLDRTEAARSSTEATLTTTEADLTTRAGERDVAQSALAKAQADLATTQAGLSSSQARVSGQANQIVNLRACLDGVLDSLVYFADERYTAAIAALDAIEIPCRNARSSLG
jgi:hypothetical protein